MKHVSRTQSLRRVLRLLPIYLLAILVALGVKYHYSRAGSEQLQWVLTPTAHLVGHITGIDFEHETDSGYVNRRRGVIIAPACAGVNFFVIAFCLSVFSFAHRFQGPHRRLGWLVGSLLLAYALTLAANTLRIALAIDLCRTDLFDGLLAPREVHRLAGITVYLGALLAWHAALERLFQVAARSTYGNSNRNPSRRSVSAELLRLARRGAPPVFWYGLIALALPAANLAFRDNPGRFAAHCGVVLAASLALWLTATLLRLFYARLRAKIAGAHQPSTGMP